MAAPVPPAPTVVILVRHGVTPTTGKVLPGRAPGLHLSEPGRTQAATTAQRLAAWADAAAARAKPATRGKKAGSPAASTAPTRVTAPVTAVYASPLERTRETAAPIAAALGTRVRPNRGLLECDFGDWTGAALKDLAKQPEWTTVQRYPSGFRFPGGESFPEMQGRIVGTIQSLCAAHPGETVVAVSHADPIKAAVAHALGTHLDLFQRIVISPCSVTAIMYGPSGPSVLTVNSTGDLGEMVPS